MTADMRWVGQGAECTKVAAIFAAPRKIGRIRSVIVDDRQITHLICVCLRHLLYDSFMGVFWAFFKKRNNRKEAQNTTQKVI